MAGWHPGRWAADFEAVGGSIVMERDGALSLFVRIFGNPPQHQDRALAMVRSLAHRHRLRRRIERWARQHRRRA